MSQTSVSVGFAPGGREFRLEYVREDNLLPSEIEAQKETEENIDAGCTVPPPKLTEAQKQAEKERLHHLDQHAWPNRKLRLYPPGPALVTCSYGQVRLGHAARSEQQEVLVFTGTDQATLEHGGVPSRLALLGRAYSPSGDEIGVTLAYRGDGLVTASAPFYGLVAAEFVVDYQVVELVALPTNEDFQVLVAAFRGGESTSAVVDFEMLEFDTGQVAGVKCEEMTETFVAKANWPAPVPRYALASMDHPSEVKQGDTLDVQVTVRNINSVKGGGVFRFSMGGPFVTAKFECEADGTAQVSVRAEAAVAGTFATTGEVLNNPFARTSGSVKVRDPNAPADTWIEDIRTESEVDVDGVVIKRIEEVTMTMDTGAKARLVFKNDGAPKP